MSEIRTEKLIQSVKLRPGLYNRNDSSYFCSKKMKSRMWTEVCKEVFSNWEQLRPQEKVEHAHELQKRWKSLRTCFTRELALQKKEKLNREKDDIPFKRRKKYEHFDSLLFLLDPDTVDNTETVNESEDESSDPLDGEMIKAEFEYQPSTSRHMLSVPNIDNSESTYQQTVYTRNETVEEKILDMLREIKKDEDDEDRQFMLSLVPSFRKLTDKQKFEAKIEMLKILKAISFQDE